MRSVLLIYPYFEPVHDRSLFRFPPLGIGYVAASLHFAGHSVSLLDCTFLTRDEAFRRARAARADVVGVYSMVTMRQAAVRFARELRDSGALLVAGGPLRTSDPGLLLTDCDVVVKGEGEHTMCDLVSACRRAPAPWSPTSIPFPARDLYPNAHYIRHGREGTGTPSRRS